MLYLFSLAFGVLVFFLVGYLIEMPMRRRMAQRAWLIHIEKNFAHWKDHPDKCPFPELLRFNDAEFGQWLFVQWSGHDLDTAVRLRQHWKNLKPFKILPPSPTEKISVVVYDNQ